MDPDEDYNVDWKNHATEAFRILAKFHAERAFTDVTLHCGDKCIRAHRVVLAACSAYLETVLCRVAGNSDSSSSPAGHTAIVLKDAPADLLEVCVSFMYTGVAHLPSERLDAFMALAESLEIRGLTSPPSSPDDDGDNDNDNDNGEEHDDGPPGLPKETSASQHTASDSSVVGHSVSVKRRSARDAADQGVAGKRVALENALGVGQNAGVNGSMATDVVEPVFETAPSPEVKTEALEMDEEGWVAEPEDPPSDDDDELYDIEEVECDGLEDFPPESPVNVPDGVVDGSLERFSEYLWRGRLAGSGQQVGQRIYFCSLCSYNNVQACNARRHERTRHTKETLYDCPTCGKKFYDKSYLNSHSVSVHGIQLSRPRKIN